jgi:hypothetical protein
MSGLRGRTLTVIAIAGALVMAGTMAVWAEGHRKGDGRGGHKGGRHEPGSKPSVARFDLSGYKLRTKYTLGRNTGNTFEQTYTSSTVQGVPVEGPFVGTVFPPADYVAMPIARKTLYLVWLGQSADHPIIDAFVMNFRTGVVFDYAPGSTSPESSGRVKILQRGPNRIP